MPQHAGGVTVWRKELKPKTFGLLTVQCRAELGIATERMKGQPAVSVSPSKWEKNTATAAAIQGWGPRCLRECNQIIWQISAKDFSLLLEDILSSLRLLQRSVRKDTGMHPSLTLHCCKRTFLDLYPTGRQMFNEVSSPVFHLVHPYHHQQLHHHHRHRHHPD